MLVIGASVAEERKLGSEPGKQAGPSFIHSIGGVPPVLKIPYGSAVYFISTSIKIVIIITDPTLQKRKLMLRKAKPGLREKQKCRDQIWIKDDLPTKTFLPS